MKKLVFCFVCFALAMLFMNSCNLSKPKEAFNDSIQGTFFGVPFGAKKKELVDKFAEKDLMLNLSISTDEFLAFYPVIGRSYTFGGMNWEILNVWMSNGQFYAIQFYNSLKDKAEAISVGMSLVETISEKYKMAKEEPKDSTTCLIYRGKSKKEKKREVVVHVSRYEAVDKTIYYGTFLQYSDNKYKAPASDEL